jgi:PKD repeat protein
MKNLIRITLYVFIGCCLLACKKDNEAANGSPVANIAADVTTGNKPLTVNFDASGSVDPDGDDLTYYWDFNDGTNYSGVSYAKTFSSEGVYNVSLTVTDTKGLEDDDNITITVNIPPSIFQVSETTQWVYFIQSEKTENGSRSSYSEGTMNVVVEDISPGSNGEEIITLRATGKRYFNNMRFADRLYIVHKEGEYVKITTEADKIATARPYLDFVNSSASNFTLFFSFPGDRTSFAESSIDLGIGNFSAFRIDHHTDNWGESYVDERYDWTAVEFYNPVIGLLYHENSSYYDMLDCSYCPVYGGSKQITLSGYYVPQDDGSVLQGGSGTNPSNPYADNLGLRTIWASEDIGSVKVYFENEYAGNFHDYFPGGIDCDEPEALNVFMPAGTYLLTADSHLGYRWEGYVDFIEGECRTLELVHSSSGNAFGEVLVAVDK